MQTFDCVLPGLANTFYQYLVFYNDRITIYGIIQWKPKNDCGLLEITERKVNEMVEQERIAEAIDFIRRKQLELRERPVGKEIKKYALMEARAERKKQKEIEEQFRNYSQFDTVPEAKFQFMELNDELGIMNEECRIKNEERPQTSDIKPQTSDMSIDNQWKLVEKIENTFAAMSNRQFRNASNTGRMNIFAASDLEEKEIREKQPLITGFLNMGTYVFAGAPKVGKSFLVLETAYHVSTGTPMWGYETRKADVLYLALEDDENRIKERLNRMFGRELPKNLFISTSAGDLNGKLFLQLQYALCEHPDIKLIIIDTLQMIRGEGSGYGSDYEAVGSLKKFADTFGLCMLIVHHTRKQGAKDIFDTISGSTGISGAADGAYVMYKEERISSGAAIDFTGRDREDKRIFLRRDPETLAWEMADPDDDIWKDPNDELLESIDAILDSNDGIWEGTATELAYLLNTEKKTNALSRELNSKKNRLKEEFGIDFGTSRDNRGRRILLNRMKAS